MGHIILSHIQKCVHLYTVHMGPYTHAQCTLTHSCSHSHTRAPTPLGKSYLHYKNKVHTHLYLYIMTLGLW